MRKGSTLDNLEVAIGGRAAVIEKLELAPLDKRQQHFLDLLSDPRRATESVYTIAKDAGIRPMQVLDLLRTATTAAATAVAMGRLTEALPSIADDLAKKSVDAIVTCPQCLGSGESAQDVACVICNGRGQVLRQSDIDRQKMVLETTGVLKKGPGVAVNVQQNNVGTINSNNFFSKYVKDSDTAAYDVDPIEAEVVKDGEKS